MLGETLLKPRLSCLCEEAILSTDDNAMVGVIRCQNLVAGSNMANMDVGKVN